MSMAVEVLSAFGIKVKNHDEVVAGTLLGTGLDLIWAYGGPIIRASDPGWLGHYHVSLALFLTDDPVAHGLGVALLVPDIITDSPFGIFDSEPNRSANLAVGFTELGLLAVKHAWRARKKRR